MSVLDELKILIQQAQEKLKKEGRLLDDEGMRRQQEAHEHIIASDAIEGIYFTDEELQVFHLMHEARLPVVVQTDLTKKYIEITLGVKVP